MAFGLEDISEVADESVGHVVKSDDVRSFEFDHGELLLGQRRHDASVATEKDDVVLNDAEKQNGNNGESSLSVPCEVSLTSGTKCCEDKRETSD